MNSVIICGENIARFEDPSFSTFPMEHLQVGCGLIEEEELDFNPGAAEHQRSLLLRKKAFSCNYRDKSLIIQTVMQANQHPDEFLYCGIGSDFVAEVLALGAQVTEFQVGDLVIGDNAYPQARTPHVMAGIPTNEASNLFQILEADKVLKVPEGVSIPFAAGMSIGAQTSYGIVRRVAPQKDDMILVTAAKSSTSLFVICALKAQGFENVYVLSSSDAYSDELAALGVKQLIKVNYQNPALFDDHTEIQRVLNGRNGFDIVIDPFVDTHVFGLARYLNFGARYMTCGVQYYQFEPPSKELLSSLFMQTIARNLSIMGNCLGTSKDLSHALKDCAEGRLPVPIDSIFKGNEVGTFFERTYLAKDRWGRVIYDYRT